MFEAQLLYVPIAFALIFVTVYYRLARATPEW